MTVEDALIPTSWQYTIAAAHQDLPMAFTQSGELAKEVLAVRSPPPPTPLLVSVPGALVQLLGAPPILALNALGGRGLSQPGGDC